MGGIARKLGQNNHDTVKKTFFSTRNFKKIIFFNNCKVFIGLTSYYHELKELACSVDKHFSKHAVKSKHVWTDLYIADAAEHGGKVKTCCLVSNQPGMPCKGEESLTEELLLVHRMQLLLLQSEWYLIAH